jgi:hypothetical protein
MLFGVIEVVDDDRTDRDMVVGTFFKQTPDIFDSFV